MAMEAVYFKEHEGILHNSVPAAPWWTASYGTQPFLGDSLRQSNGGSFGGRSNSGEQFTASKQAAPVEQIPDKENPTQFTISTGDKDSGEVQKSQAPAITIPPADYCNRFELGFGQPMYPYADPCYGVFSPHGPQLAGRIMLPLDLGADDGPIFVNPKQYHGIIRRRKCRAKAELLNRATRARKQAYMHESRHLHAMRRPRGSGGRFLNTKTMPNTKGADPNKDRGGPTALHQPTGSQSSEVLQSDSGSSKETNGGGPMSMSVAEVTSMYAREDLNRFSMTHHLRPSIHFIPHMMDGGRRSMVIPSKWVAAAAPDGSCCNLKV